MTRETFPSGSLFEGLEIRDVLVCGCCPTREYVRLEPERARGV